jgi:serine/threonine protein kinase
MIQLIISNAWRLWTGTRLYGARTDRPNEPRSDLYALGVTFYQMITGSLPFTAAEPMEWVRCHVARKPVPPHERLDTVPEAVSALHNRRLFSDEELQFRDELDHKLPVQSRALAHSDASAPTRIIGLQSLGKIRGEEATAASA